STVAWHRPLAFLRRSAADRRSVATLHQRRAAARRCGRDDARADPSGGHASPAAARADSLRARPGRGGLARGVAGTAALPGAAAGVGVSLARARILADVHPTRGQLFFPARLAANAPRRRLIAPAFRVDSRRAAFLA